MSMWGRPRAGGPGKSTITNYTRKMKKICELFECTQKEAINNYEIWEKVNVPNSKRDKSINEGVNIGGFGTAAINWFRKRKNLPPFRRKGVKRKAPAPKPKKARKKRKEVVCIYSDSSGAEAGTSEETEEDSDIYDETKEDELNKLYDKVDALTSQLLEDIDVLEDFKSWGESMTRRLFVEGKKKMEANNLLKEALYSMEASTVDDCFYPDETRRWHSNQDIDPTGEKTKVFGMVGDIRKMLELPAANEQGDSEDGSATASNFEEEPIFLGQPPESAKHPLLQLNASSEHGVENVQVEDLTFKDDNSVTPDHAVENVEIEDSTFKESSQPPVKPVTILETLPQTPSAQPRIRGPEAAAEINGGYANSLLSQSSNSDGMFSDGNKKEDTEMRTPEQASSGGLFSDGNQKQDFEMGTPEQALIPSPGGRFDASNKKADFEMGTIKRSLIPVTVESVMGMIERSLAPVKVDSAPGADNPECEVQKISLSEPAGICG